MPDMLIVATAALLGFIVGSSVNAFVYRLHARNLRGFLVGRSICPSCKKQLTVHDLIPLVSFAFLRSRCRMCHKPISWHYPLIELVTAITFGLTTFVIGVANFPQLIAALAFVTVLIILASYDWQYGEIPDEISLPAIGLVLTASFFQLTPVDWLGSLIGLAVGGGLFFLLVAVSNGRWMGGGDIRLGMLLGAFLGWQGALLTIFLASFIGAIAGISLIIAQHLVTRSKKSEIFNLKSSIPFAPALALAGLITLLWGQPLITWYVANYFPVA